MTLGKYKIWFLIALFVVLIPVRIFAEEANDIQYKFTRTDSVYSFYSSFKINADPKCLLEVSFNYEHIRALALGCKRSPVN